MNLVYGSSFSSYMDCMVFFGGECCISRRSRVRITPCSCICVSVVGLIILGHPFCGSPTFRMSTRRLPFILFVSRFEYPHISCYLLLGVPEVAVGDFYFVCLISHVSNLRLVYHLLIVTSSGHLRGLSANLTHSVLGLSVIVITLTFSCPLGLCFSASLPLVSSRARLESDVLEPQPGVTAGHCRMFQALGVPDRSPSVSFDIPQ